MSGITRRFKSWARGLSQPAQTEPITVLVVDDEEPVRRFVARALALHGYLVTSASDGVAGLEAAAAAEKPFDLLFTDLMMPEMNGDELAMRLRQKWPSLKVLYLTGHSERLFAERMTLWADEAFLDKPCTVNALLEAVSLLMFQSIRRPDVADGDDQPSPWSPSFTRNDSRILPD
jgi:CheY-like chemotaxis protein